MEYGRIPSDYLRYILKWQDLWPSTRAEVEAELRRRGSAGRAEPKADNGHDKIVEVLTAWYRKKAMELHPDRGGSHIAMQVLNSLWLELKNIIT